MKIKHWQGYGVIEAKRIRDKRYDLCVVVSGNHEWGLRRDDDYDVFRWLVQRFDKQWKEKTYADFRGSQMFVTSWEYYGTDYCQYAFVYRK